MRNKVFDQISTIVDIKVAEIESYFVSYLITIEIRIKEMKSRSYGGYEIRKLVDDFSENINLKSSELIDTITNLAINCGRKILSKQYLKLIEKCSSSFESIINRFSELITKEFEFTETVNQILTTLKYNVRYKIENSIIVIKIFLNKKIDKALRWAIIGVVVSTLLSIIAIAISIV